MRKVYLTMHFDSGTTVGPLALEMTDKQTADLVTACSVSLNTEPLTPGTSRLDWVYIDAR